MPTRLTSRATCASRSTTGPVGRPSSPSALHFTLHTQSLPLHSNRSNGKKRATPSPRSTMAKDSATRVLAPTGRPEPSNTRPPCRGAGPRCGEGNGESGTSLASGREAGHAAPGPTASGGPGMRKPPSGRSSSVTSSKPLPPGYTLPSAARCSHCGSQKAFSHKPGNRTTSAPRRKPARASSGSVLAREASVSNPASSNVAPGNHAACPETGVSRSMGIRCTVSSVETRSGALARSALVERGSSSTPPAGPAEKAWGFHREVPGTRSRVTRTTSNRTAADMPRTSRSSTRTPQAPRPSTGDTTAAEACRSGASPVPTAAGRPQMRTVKPSARPKDSPGWRAKCWGGTASERTSPSRLSTLKAWGRPRGWKA